MTTEPNESSPRAFFDSLQSRSGTRALLKSYRREHETMRGTTPRKKFVQAHAGNAEPATAEDAAQFDGYPYS